MEKRDRSEGVREPPEKRRREGNIEYKLMKKRTDYLNWDDYFMAVAFLSAQRSKDPKSQV